MYDDEEEIKRKRRNLIIAIAVIVGLIILLIFLLILGSNSKPKTKNTAPECDLIVTSDTKQNEKGAYTGPITIEFDKDKTKASNGLTLTYKKIGITDSQRNSDVYKLSKSGKTVVYGYIRDSKGVSATCSKEFTIESAKPNCELEVKSGTPGENGWYTSDVVVTFKSKTVDGGTIEKYSIEEVTRDFDTDEILNRAPEENNDTYTVKKDAEVEVIGTVVDNSGVESTCMLKVKKDAEKPTCTLEVRSGTKDSGGKYTGNVTIGFEKAEDLTSTLKEKGVGVEENYKDETYTVNAGGKTVVYGYVKDGAGNKGTCSLDISKDGSSEESTSNPSCKLKVTGTSQDGKYIGTVKVTFESKTTDKDAKIESYGISTSPQLNGSDNLSVSELGSHKIYGLVKDSNGNSAECRVSFTIAQKTETKDSTPSCSLYVDATANGSGGYLNNATVKFASMQSTNGAKITEYGIGTKAQLSGNNTFSVTSPGNYTLVGMVKDSYGHTATCSKSFTVTSGSTPQTGNLATQVLKAGYTVNYTKNAKSIVCGSSKDTAGASGWEVLKVTSSGVELVSKGVPECYAKPSNISGSQAVSNINALGSKYLDSKYASKVRFMDYNDAMSYGANNNAAANNKRNVGVVYWLATQGTKTNNLYAVRNGASSSLYGQVYEANYQTLGVRPVVVLKTNVYAVQNASGSWDLSVLTKDYDDDTLDNSMLDKIIEIINSTLLADLEIDE